MYEGFLFENRICNLCGEQGKIGIHPHKFCFSCGACKKDFVDPYAVPLKTFVREQVTDLIGEKIITHFVPKVSTKEDIPFDVDNAFAVWHNQLAVKDDLANRKVDRESEWSWDWTEPQSSNTNNKLP